MNFLDIVNLDIL